jgi:predicted CoA-binding protein
MSTLNEAVADFLAQQRIAVTGVSRSKKGQPANLIYRKLRDKGYVVFPVNPAAEEVEGDTCYASLESIPGGVDGVVIATAPDDSLQVVKDCAALNIPRVWFHRAMGQGSASPEAIAYAREHGVAVIPAGCPMMYCEPDIGHRCMRWFYQTTGRIPQQV